MEHVDAGFFKGPEKALSRRGRRAENNYYKAESVLQLILSFFYFDF